MKRKVVLSLAVLSLAFFAGCNSQNGTDTVNTETAQVEDSVESGSGYASKDGWSVKYDDKNVTVNEHGNTESFVYTGECAGTTMINISYVKDKQPQEVLTESIKDWDPENVVRSEGYFAGDKWCFMADSKEDKTGSGLIQGFTAAEYNGGVLLIERISHIDTDEERGMAVSDTMANILDSMEFEEYKSQTQYSYVSGTYVNSDKTKTVELKEDHTGNLTLDGKKESLIWYTTEIALDDSDTKYEYTIEGNNLLLNVGDEWLEFTKSVAAGSNYEGNWREKSAERVVADISKNSATGLYDVEITWREDLPQKDVYTMSAEYKDDGTLYYENGVHVIRTFEKDGSYSDDVQYENGTGVFKLDIDSNEISWTDNNEKSEENVQVFIKGEI